MYKRTTQARSDNRCRRGKAVSITQAECVVLPYVSSTQSACAVLHCHLLSVWTYHIFPHYLINGTIFGQMSLNMKHIVWFSLRLCQKHFLF
jgi:hypothetical protein